MALIEFENEKRSAQQLSDLPGYERFFGDSQSPSKVTRKKASGLAAVYSCTDAISSDLAGVPIQLLKKVGNVVTKQANHPVCEKLKLSPNPEMVSFILRQTRGLNVLNQGNGYILIEGSILNPVKNLWLLDPDAVDVVRTKTKRGKNGTSINPGDSLQAETIRGHIQYKVQDGYKTKTYSSKDILHLKGPSWNGLVGESIITSEARKVLSTGLEMDQFISSFFRDGMNPGGIMTHPTTFGAKKEEFITALKKVFNKKTQSRTPMVLEDGMTYTPYDVKMADQEFLDMMKLNRVDICGMYGVPPSRISISDSNTNYNNSEQEARLYVRSGLLKWAIQDEQDMNLKLLTDRERKEGYYFKYNFNAILRGDSKTRAEVNKTYNDMGYPLNRMLETEDLNPVDGGDIGLVQLNKASIIEVGKPFKEDDPSSNDSRSFNNNPEFRALNKTIAHRKRVQKTFEPLIRAAAQRLVDRETLAIKRESKKQAGTRSVAGMEKWLNNFYADFDKYLDKELTPILRAYAVAIQDAVAGEVGSDAVISDELQTEINEYIDGYKRQYIDSSRGQMLGELKIGLDEIDTRADEWHEKRADKETDSESNGVSNFIATFVIAGAGISPTWRIIGKTCVFCHQLNGKKIKRYGDSFLKSGAVLKGDVDGTPRTMEVRTTKYPPLHGGCDCVISAG